MLTDNLIKAQIIELKVEEELLRYGFDISIPTYNASKYDLIADTGNGFIRIQVKKSIYTSNSSFTFRCTNQNVRSKTGKKHKYTVDEIDYFATVWHNKVYLVPVGEPGEAKTIKFDDETFLAKNVLSDYERLSDEELYNTMSHGKYYCEDCGCNVSPYAKRCLCCRNAKRAASIPQRHELKKLLRILPFTKVGEKYGVTDNAVRRWCAKYGLPKHSSIIKQYSDTDWDAL